MMDSPAPTSGSSLKDFHTGTSQDTQTSRKRTITACLTCRRRKVKCDHTQPICSPCKKGNRICTYASPQSASQTHSRPGNGSRISRSNLRTGQDDIRNRLERLEQLLERAIDNGITISQPPDAKASSTESPRNHSQRLVELSDPPTETLSADGYDGALLLEAQGGQSRWVSSLHYALLADEIHDVKMLLGDQFSDTPIEGLPSAQAMPPFPFSGTLVDSLDPWAPDSPDTCSKLLEIFCSNVDPMTRIVHKPTLGRRLAQYISHTYSTETPTASHIETETSKSMENIHSFEPLALAVFYSAINSLSAEDVMLQFAVEKQVLLSQFQRGVEFGLGRENFLTTTSIEVLQAFVLLLTCQTREDDMSKTWALLGLVYKMALSQGIHREPSLFSSRNMDAVQVEIRRRLWHQICHLDFRSAEGRGQEPTISDDDYTTLLPRNISDDDLVEEAHPSPATFAPAGFTDMTGHLIRLHGHHCFRRIVRSTYKLERRIKSQQINSNINLDPVAELQSLFEEVRGMVDEMVTHFQTQYLQYCKPQIPEQRMALGLATVVEWRCWSIFWLRTPKQYREAVVTPEIRQTVLEKSISLIESLNMRPEDKDTRRFQWHIGGHACFQSIMHIISELDMHEFDAPNRYALRSRALDVLRKTMNTRGREDTPMWNAMNHIISNCLAKKTQKDFPLTPFQTNLSEDRVVPRLVSSNTGPTPVVQPSFPASGESAVIDSLPDPSDLGMINIQDPDIAFDWGFWNFDPADPSSY